VATAASFRIGREPHGRPAKLHGVLRTGECGSVRVVSGRPLTNRIARINATIQNYYGNRAGLRLSTRRTQLSSAGRRAFFTKLRAREAPILVHLSSCGDAYEFDGFRRIRNTASEPMRIVALGPGNERQHCSCGIWPSRRPWEQYTARIARRCHKALLSYGSLVPRISLLLPI
jgi:hypothetical protein